MLINKLQLEFPNLIKHPFLLHSDEIEAAKIYQLQCEVELIAFTLELENYYSKEVDVLNYSYGDYYTE